MGPVRVLIADDHTGYREGLARLIELEASLAVVAIASGAAEAAALANALRPDVALVDVRMPDEDGVVACRRIRALSPATAVVLITGTPEDGLAAAADAAGAAGLLGKEERPAVIRAALLAAAGRRDRR